MQCFDDYVPLHSFFFQQYHSRVANVKMDQRQTADQNNDGYVGNM